MKTKTIVGKWRFFIDEDGNDGEIGWVRTDNFKNIARELSDYINTLPLTNNQHNILIELMIRQVIEAEKEYFDAGLECERDILDMGNNKKEELLLLNQ
jgi:hypothetical protein